MEIMFIKQEDELLRLSFDIMSRALISATFKKLTQDIKNLCKFYVD